VIFEKDNWQEIFATIRKNKVRTALTMFGVFWGIFMLVIMLGAGSGLRHGVMQEFAGEGTNSFFIWAQTTSKPYKGMKSGRNYQFKNGDAIALQKIDELEVISPENQLGDYGNSNNVIRGLKVGNFEVLGEYPSITKIENIKLQSGRFINQNDFNDYRKVCVIGIPVRDALFKTENPIDKFIDVSGTKYKVVGVFNDPGKGDNDRIYIPLLTAQRIYNGKDNVNVIWASTGTVSTEYSNQMVSTIRNALAKKYHFNPLDMNAVGIFNNNVEYKRIMGMLDGIKIFVFIIGVFTLIAGVVGVSNIMMIVVKERTKEIGVRKALGASPWSIVSLIIQESVFITSIAGYIGLMLGIGLVELIKYFELEGDFFKNPEVDLSIAITAVVLIVVAGALAGLFPAIKAAKVEPITALRES